MCIALLPRSTAKKKNLMPAASRAEWRLLPLSKSAKEDVWSTLLDKNKQRKNKIIA